jgi:urease accessory protein
MLIIESVQGNLNEEEWKQRLQGGTLDYLELDQWQAQKNRLRTKTQAGKEIALSLERNSQLRDGDILTWDEAAKTGVIARIHLQDVLVIDMSAVNQLDVNESLQLCFELGHALGNQHWPAVIKNDKIYVPLTVDRKVMASVMRTHAFAHLTYQFVPGTEVIPYFAPHEARRLFGGAGSTPHSHLSGNSLSPASR